MRRLVDLTAPRGAWDFVFKLLVAQLALLVTYAAQELALDGPPQTSWANHFQAVLILGLPFGGFALALLAHMRKLQQQLTHLAATDWLTGLLNRRGFRDAVGPAGRVARTGLILMVDVDHFKKVNDRHGHGVGDLCLQAVAGRLRDLAAQSDHLGRYGGEEFSMFIAETGRGRLGEVIRGLERGVLVELGMSTRPLHVTVSAGAARARPGMLIDEVLRAADVALYRAKEAGRARVMISTEAA